MKKAKRVFLIVLDSFGIGEAPDAAEFGVVEEGGDVGGDTLGSVASSPRFNAPCLTDLGLFNIDGQAKKIPGGVLPAACGEGRLDWPELMAALKEFDGPAMIEYELTGDVRDGMRRSLDFLKRF